MFRSIDLMWRGGCIITSVFLGNIKEAYDKDPGLSDVLFDTYFAKEIDETQEA